MKSRRRKRTKFKTTYAAHTKRNKDRHVKASSKGKFETAEALNTHHKKVVANKRGTKAAA